MSDFLTHTCRFCHGQMNRSAERIADYGKPTQYVAAYMFLCRNCHSEQTIDLNNKLVDYDFRIGPYELCFYPETPSFQIRHYHTPGSFAYKTILRINCIPKNLTPKTCTVDRIKLLILFS